MNIPSSRRSIRISLLFAACAALLPLRVLALGGDPNLLLKSKPLPAGQGYVLFSMVYAKADFRPFETPCIRVEMQPLVAPGAAGKKAPRSQYLSTTTGLHCDTAWKNEATVAQEGDRARVVILTVVPPGEYEIRTGTVQYSAAMDTYKGEPDVVGFGRVQVNAGQLAYAGAFQLLKAPGRSLLQAQDNWQKDAEVLHRLRPDLASVEVVQATWESPTKPR